MMIRNRYMVLIVLATLSAFMAIQPGTSVSAEPKPIIVQVLFVQNAEAVVFDKGTLTLKNVSPMTVFFSDRPVRIAGHFNTKDEFVPLWDEGKDSFLKDPPNATVSMYEKGREQLEDVVVNATKLLAEEDERVGKLLNARGLAQVKEIMGGHQYMAKR